MKDVKDVKELRVSLTDVFKKLQNDKIAPEKASQLVNCAGKIIGTIRIEIEYAQAREEKPSIEFMDEKESD